MGAFAVILPAAGRSTRFGGPSSEKKIYVELAGRAVWLRAVQPFVDRPDVAQVIIAVAPEDRVMFEDRYGAQIARLRLDVIEGGMERHDTVSKALQRVRPECAFVAVHDAARPCVLTDLIDAVFKAARQHGAALPGLPVTDTLKRVSEDQVALETVPRAGLVAVQTPQAFRRDLLEQAYANKSSLAAAITDDAQLVEALGHPVHVVPGSRWNLKITTHDDVELAVAMLDILDRKSRAMAAYSRAGDFPLSPRSSKHRRRGKEPS